MSSEETDGEKESQYDYQQLRIPKYIRSALRKHRDDTEGINTLSGALLDILPADIEENKIEIEEDEFVLISVDEESHEKVHELAGENVTSYTAIERFFRQKAQEDGLDEIAKIFDEESK